MLLYDLQIAVEGAIEQTGRAEISVSAWPSLSANEIARCAQLPHSRIRVSSVGRIREAGFDVESDRAEDCHANVIFPMEPADGDLLRLTAAFDAPVTNPHRNQT